MREWGDHATRVVGALTLTLLGCQPAPLPTSDARSGFEVGVDGFSFPNFGGESQSARLNATSVARMFGEDAVCASMELGGCRLTPLASTWMQKVNASMRGGRCEGFAVLSGLFYEGALNPADFGATDAFDLQLSNPQIGPEIAYWFSTQFLRDVVKESTRTLDAREAAAFLSEAYRQTPLADLYRVGMVKVANNGKVTGGHAMVATAVLVDTPGKRFRIQVYDNNHPGEPRFIEVDAEANSWSYQASSNPTEAASLYEGTEANKNLLYFAPLKNRTGKQRCAFCNQDAETATEALNQIFSFGSVEVAAVDDSGHATGVVEGRFVNTMPGASLAPNFSVEPWQDPMPPIIFVPTTATTQGSSLSFRVAGTGGNEPMHMTLFGPGRAVGLSGAAPAEGATDEVTVSNGGTSVSVTRESDAGGAFTVTAISETSDGGQVEVSLTVPADEGSIRASVQLDDLSGNAVVSANGDNDLPVEISIVQSSATGEHVIEGSTVAPPGGSLQLNVAGYSEDAGVLEVSVDQDGDGTPEMSVPVTNHGPSSPPAVPQGLVAMAVAHNRVQLTWHDVSRYETSFTIERATGNASFAPLVELSADTQSYADTTVVALDSYRYRVRATNEYGPSAWSNEVTVTSPDCPTGSQDFDRDGVCAPNCSVTVCDLNARCEDASGHALCACLSGFVGDGSTCTDIDECLVDNGGCGEATYWSCTNNSGAAPTCNDINECVVNNGGCGDAAYWSCANNSGAAPTCADIDECLVNNGGCGDAAYWACTNNVGAAPTCNDINECLVNNGGCGDATYWACTNRLGAAPTCGDINECLVNNGGCGDVNYWACSNNLGAAPSCSDINECLVNNGGCGDSSYWSCTNNSGAPPTCADTNECLVNNGGCGDATYWHCANNAGAAPTCADIDECLVSNGGCGDSTYWSCTNNSGAAPTCSDINECLVSNGGCGDSTYWSCTNNSGAAPTCADIDECLANNGGCGDSAYWHCANNAGAAPTCSDIDECLANNGGCGDSTYWTCTNNSGAAPTCNDVDECLVNNGGCGDSTYWSCTNNAGAAPTCADINECLANNGGCGDATYWACTNNSGAAPTCADIDECLVNNGGCGVSGAGTCSNRVGQAPLCSCAPGRAGPACATLVEFITSAVNASSHEAVVDMVRDATGNMYLALHASGPNDYGNGVTIGSRGGNDVVIVSYDVAGVARWAVDWGSTGNDRVAKLAIDTAGNVFVVGTASATPFVLDGTHSLAQNGGYVASLTSTGVVRWARSVATDARAVAVDPSGNVAVSGYAASAFNYGLGTQQARGVGDSFLVSYSNDGQTTRWANVYGTDPNPGMPDNSFDDLAFDSTGALYAAGHINGPNGNVGGATLVYAGQQTGVLASYTNAGAHRWSKSFVPVGVSYLDSAVTNVAVDAAGHVAAFVRFRDTVDLGGGPITTPNPGSVGVGGTGVGALAIFASSTGTYLTQRTFFTGIPVMAYDLAFDANGELFVAGNANNGGADLGGGPTHSGAFVAGYDSALGYRFAKVATGGAYPSAQAIVPTDDGDVYAAGQFDNTTMSFGVGSVVESGSGSDLWLARMHPHLPVSAGLVARFNARDHSSLTLAGATVNGWNDTSGSGHALTVGSAAPTLLASALNARPALDFATGKGLISQPFALTTDVTVFVIASWPASPDTWGNLAHHGHRDNDWSLERNGTLSNVIHFQSNNDNAGVQLTCTQGAPTLFIGQISGTTRTLRIVDPSGDRQVSATGVSISAGSKTLWVGRSDVNESSNAIIGELVYFNRALSSPEVDAVIAELTTAWGFAH